MADTITIKDDGLKRLIKAMSGKIPKARVGILGDGTPRDPRAKPAEVTHESLMRRAVDKKGAKKAKKQEEPTNAAVGARWEFDPKFKRSFLRVPLMDNLNKYLKAAGAFDQAAMDRLIKTGDLHEYVEKVGNVGLTVVLDAFATAGFGKWVPSNMKYKKNKQTLIENQQLIRSMTMDVK